MSSSLHHDQQRKPRRLPSKPASLRPHQPRNAHSNPLTPRPLTHEHASINPGTYLIIVSPPRHLHRRSIQLPFWLARRTSTEMHSRRKDKREQGDFKRYENRNHKKAVKACVPGVQVPRGRGRRRDGWMVVRETDCLERLTRFNSCHQSGTIMSSRHAS